MWTDLKQVKILNRFPSCSVEQNPPANSGDMGSTVDQERPLMPQNKQARVPQLLCPGAATPGPCATTAKAHMPWACALQQEKPHRANGEQPSLSTAQEKAKQHNQK